MQHGSHIISNKAESMIKRLEKVHILVMDTSPQVTDMFRDMLKEFGFTNVFTANNGSQGVHILREFKINLVITDWDIKYTLKPQEAPDKGVSRPDVISISGIGFVMQLRRSMLSSNPFVPVIMFADAVDHMKLFEARDAGVNEICLKPLNIRELCDRITAIVDRPRIFITADTYKGPCRRRNAGILPPGQVERRKRKIQIIKYGETGGGR